MWNMKQVSNGDCSQKTCKIGVFGDYMFVVGKGVVQSSRAPALTVTFEFIIPSNKLTAYMIYERL